MRFFRRLSPLVFMALLLTLTSVAMLVATLISLNANRASSSSPPLRSLDLLVIALNLEILSGACTFAVSRSKARLRQRSREPLPPTSWRNQARTILPLATLPLCAIAAIAVFPSTFSVLLGAAACTVLAAFVLLVAHVWALSRPVPLQV